MEDAFEDGFNLVEVEFPPLQQDYLEDSGSSAYDVSSANVRLASRFAQSFAAEGKVGLASSQGTIRPGALAQTIYNKSIAVYHVESQPVVDHPKQEAWLTWGPPSALIR